MAKVKEMLILVNYFSTSFPKYCHFIRIINQREVVNRLSIEERTEESATLTTVG